MRFTCALKTMAIGFALTASGVAYAQGGGGGNGEDLKKAETAARAQENAKSLEGSTAPKLPPATVPVEPENVWDLDLSSGGRVRIQLRPDIAPNHVERIKTLTAVEGGTVEARISGESFLTQPGPLSDLVTAAVRDVTGVEAELSTTGGTSDARFLSRLCPVVEFGLNNATMHKLDEAVAVQDLRDLQRIYARIAERALRPV